VTHRAATRRYPRTKNRGGFRSGKKLWNKEARRARSGSIARVLASRWHGAWTATALYDYAFRARSFWALRSALAASSLTAADRGECFDLQTSRPSFREALDK